MRETTLDATGPDGNWRRRHSADGRDCRRLVHSIRHPHTNWTRFWGLHSSLSGGLRRTLADESPVITIRFELENDSGGRWWTVNSRSGSQKVRGSNPLGSTNFEIGMAT